jgi:hypothetical protein
MNEENENEEDHKVCDCECHQMHGPMKREFKLAMLEKKEKILKAKLEFVGKMKDMIEKIPAEKK